MRIRVTIVAVAFLSLTTGSLSAMALCDKQVVDNPDEITGFERGRVKYELDFSHDEVLDDGSCISHLVATPTR